MSKLTDEAKDMISRPYYGWVTTVRRDGSLHSTVVWVDLDGDDVVFNTAVGRAKERNLRRDPRVSLSVLDPEDPFHLVSISGTATLTEEGADETIDALAKKYLGLPAYPNRVEGERRVNVRIRPESVIYNGGGH